MDEVQYFICPQCGSKERNTYKKEEKSTKIFEFTEVGVNSLVFCSNCDVVMEFETNYQDYTNLMGGLGA